jgi:hypothetical protein
VWFFATRKDDEGRPVIDDKDRRRLTIILDLIKFGMSNPLIDFDGEYFEYDGGKEINDKGLTIKGYESAFLADMVVAHLLEVVEDDKDGIFLELKFFKVYRDDGITLFRGKKNTVDIKDWLYDFQNEINTIAGTTS